MRRILFPLIVFLAAGAYYWRQACPTFYFWDSAELTAAVLGGGVPHPPGFPFFLLISKIWQSLVPLDPKFSLNIFAVFFGALGSMLWYLVIFKTLRLLNALKDEIMISLVSLLAVALMAVSLTYSIQATRYEVYSLNFTGFAGLILICLSIVRRERTSAIWSLALFVLLGLFLAVHNLTIALAIPGLILFLVLDKKITPGYAILGIIGSFFLAGLFYLTLLLLAAGNPPLNWGNPSNLGRLVDYILVKGFAASTSRLSPSHLGAELGFAYDVIYKQIGPAALALALFGLGYLIWRKREIGLPLAVTLVLNIFSVAFAETYFYENYDLHGYLMISLAVTIVFLAVTFSLILNYILARLHGRRAGVTRFLAVTLFVIFAMLVIAPQAGENFLSANLSRVKGAEEYAGRFLSDAPRDAVIITSSYNTYFCALAYEAAYAGAIKKTILNLYNWDHDWGRAESDRLLGMQSDDDLTRQSYYRGLLNQTMNNRPIYIEFDPASIPIAKYLYPHGLGYLFVIPDSAAAHPMNQSDDSLISMASNSTDLETIRTWVLWLQNRGEYYKQRGNEADASRYFGLIDTLASKANLQ